MISYQVSCHNLNCCLLQQVTELSRPSSPEVEEVIHQLAQNTLQRFFKEEIPSGFMEEESIGSTINYNNADEHSDTIGTSRDYLAKLLFWFVFSRAFLLLQSFVRP